VLAFTDSDCFPTRGWLAAGLARIRDGAELVQGAIHPAPDDRGGPFARRFWVTRDVGLHETANLFVTRRAFHAAGGFERVVDDRDGRPMGEDTWFGWRVRRAGAPYEFAPDLVVEHEVFDRGGREYVRERRRDGHFAELAARMPELRGTLFFGRFFLSRRSAAFDAAVLGAATAALRRSPWPLALGLPYAVLLWRIVAGAGTAGPRLAAIHLAGDATGFGSLVRGSLRARSPVL
jgi:hypothetical protein